MNLQQQTGYQAEQENSFECSKLRILTSLEYVSSRSCTKDTGKHSCGIR